MYNITFLCQVKVLIYTKYKTAKEKFWLEWEVSEAGLMLLTRRFKSYFLYFC
jgi:hypothetical protein